jgi:hypothetical protein
MLVEVARVLVSGFEPETSWTFDANILPPPCMHDGEIFGDRLLGLADHERETPLQGLVGGFRVLLQSLFSWRMEKGGFWPTL